MRILLATLCLLPLPLSANSAFDVDEARILQQGLVQTAETFILPNYRAQSEAAEALEGSLRAYCGEQGEIAEVKSDFADLFLAWQRASIIQIGRVMEEEGPLRFQLWPDPKGFSRRAVLAAVNAKDPDVLNLEELENHSIALRTTSALERLIYDDLAPATYACDLSVAIARYQSAQASALVADWTVGSAFRAAFDTAAQGNATFEDVDAVSRQLIAGMVVYLDRLRKFKILRGLGEEPGAARIERSEARQSGLGLASVATSMDALADLYLLEDGFFAAAANVGATQDPYFLGSVLKGIAQSLVSSDTSFEVIYAEDGADAQQLREDAKLLKFHEEFLKVDFPASIGLTTGFTSADGD